AAARCGAAADAAPGGDPAPVGAGPLDSRDRRRAPSEPGDRPQPRAPPPARDGRDVAPGGGGARPRRHAVRPLRLTQSRQAKGAWTRAPWLCETRRPGDERPRALRAADTR